MMRAKFLIFPVALLVLLVGCGTYSHQVASDGSSYLLLIGEPEGESVKIDGAAPFVLGKNTESFDLNGREATKIRIPRGKHRVKITRGGNLLLDRVFFISEGQSFELEIP